MILQLLYEANTNLPCSLSEMPKALRYEIRKRLNGFLTIIETKDSPTSKAALAMEIAEHKSRELTVIRRLPAKRPLSSAS